VDRQTDKTNKQTHEQSIGHLKASQSSNQSDRPASPSKTQLVALKPQARQEIDRCLGASLDVVPKCINIYKKIIYTYINVYTAGRNPATRSAPLRGLRAPRGFPKTCARLCPWSTLISCCQMLSAAPQQRHTLACKRRKRGGGGSSSSSSTKQASKQAEGGGGGAQE